MQNTWTRSKIKSIQVGYARYLMAFMQIRKIFRISDFKIGIAVLCSNVVSVYRLTPPNAVSEQFVARSLRDNCSARKVDTGIM